MLDEADWARLREIVRDELAAAAPARREAADDPLAEALAEFAKDRDRFTLREALAAMGIERRRWTSGMLSHLGRLARGLGYERARSGVGRREWFYERRAAEGRAA